MREQHLHVTDQELLLSVEGELRGARNEQVQAHMELCSDCRARREELEGTLAEFGEAHRIAWEAELPPMAGARAQLNARLADLAVRERGNGWLYSAWNVLVTHRQAAALAGIAVAASLLFAIRLHGPVERWQPTSASLGRLEEPDLRLTPGATVPVTKNEVCGQESETAPAVPASLKTRVFELYGVTSSRPDAFEVDYLITPELGGATDIRNLWPEPYRDTEWNAHVKDQLEDRLRQMVCHGDVDLATAQHDISTDWIAAYRKYFHADRPVGDGSSLDYSGARSSLPRT